MHPKTTMDPEQEGSKHDTRPEHDTIDNLQFFGPNISWGYHPPKQTPENGFMISTVSPT